MKEGILPDSLDESGGYLLMFFIVVILGYDRAPTHVHHPAATFDSYLALPDRGQPNLLGWSRLEIL